jgi:hypothetical protein
MACDQCAVWAEVDGERILVTVRAENTDQLGIDHATWDILCRCRVCGTYWELINERRYQEIARDAAKRKYPTLVF